MGICERPAAVAGKTEELGIALGPRFPVDYNIKITEHLRV